MNEAVLQKRARVPLSRWIAPVILLNLLWLYLAFSSGALLPRHWLLPALGTAALAIVLGVLAAYPRRPRTLSLIVLALLAAYGIWGVLTVLWAASAGAVWQDAGKPIFYVVVLALAFTFFTDASARKAQRLLVLLTGLALVVVVIVRFWTSPDPSVLFEDNRLSFPISYSNGAGALFLLFFWPLLWMASDPESRFAIRAAALGCCAALLDLALLTQSRGAFWALGVSTIVILVLFPARLRMLFYLAVPTLLAFWAFPRLNTYWTQGPEAVGGAVAASRLIIALAAGAAMGGLLALLENWIAVSRRMRLLFGTVVLLLVVAGSVYGGWLVTHEAGGPFAWVQQTWSNFKSETRTYVGQHPGTDEPSTRLMVISSSGRYDIWQVAWRDFELSPWKGIGTGNFVYSYEQLRRWEDSNPKDVHSIEMGALSETGIVGTLLLFGGILFGMGAIVWARFSAAWNRIRGERANSRFGSNPRDYAWQLSLIMAAGYWLIHGSVEWLWPLPGVTLPALLCLALALSHLDDRLEARQSATSPEGILTGPDTGRSPGARGAPDEYDGSDALLDPASGTQGSATTHREVLPARERIPFFGARRADRHRRSRDRRVKRADKEARGGVWPPGWLSSAFRWALVAVSVGLFVGLAFPYLSLRFSDTAAANMGKDDQRAIGYSERAAGLQPYSAEPALLQADVYHQAALAAVSADLQGASTVTSDQWGAVLDNLALETVAATNAIARERVWWLPHFRAGLAALNLRLALYPTGTMPATPLPAGLENWPELLGEPPLEGPALAGRAPRSLATETFKLSEAARLRRLSASDLDRLALLHLTAAKSRNPLNPAITQSIRLLNELRTASAGA